MCTIPRIKKITEDTKRQIWILVQKVVKLQINWFSTFKHQSFFQPKLKLSELELKKQQTLLKAPNEPLII